MMSSIQETARKIKYYYDQGLKTLESRDIFIIALIILIAGLSFGLGTLSGQTKERSSVKIHQSASVFEGVSQNEGIKNSDSPRVSSDASDGKFVGSVNSDKYHYPWCSGAKRINEENKVWFSSKKEAAAQGYEPAGNCKGL